MTDTISAPAAEDLADRFWRWFLERQPLFGTVYGVEHLDDRLYDPSAEARAAEKSALEGFAADVRRLQATELGSEDAITVDMIGVVARTFLALQQHAVHHIDAMDQMAGPQSMPGELVRYQRVDSPERIDRLVRRLGGFPAHMAAHRANLEEGVSAGRTAPAVVVDRVLQQTQRMAATPVEQAPLLAAHPELDDEARRRIREVLVQDVQPALAEYASFVEGYRAHARTDDGLWSMPGGDQLYRTLILASTTLEATPQELHDYGNEQLELIGAEREAVARDLGFASVASLRADLDADPSNTFTERDQLLELARRQIERASAAAPRWFGRLPVAAVEVRAVESFQEAEAPPAFYAPPAPDGSRGGVYYVNTYQLESRPRHRLAATTFHEAVPGHHFQIALETELVGLPLFRRLGGRLAGIAYPEGWGLYAERLADEMGLYEDARERLGMLDAQAWRAARLVVDTGIHALRWTRQQSVELLRRIGLSQLEAETETDRYISWPGQALAYMTGMREIVALRRQLEERDGDRFDLPGFHDAVLGHGTLPLATLRRELPDWVKPRPA